MEDDKPQQENNTQDTKQDTKPQGDNTPEANTQEHQAQLPADELRDKVMQAIKEVYDPEIPVDIYELGLIYEVNVYPVNNVYVLMTLTSPACPSAEQIPGEVEQKIKEIEGVQEVQVELTFDPPYTQDMMSEAAKLELGFL